MLLEPSVVDASMAELTKDCFYDKKNQMIFEAMSKLVTEHTSLDIITACFRQIRCRVLCQGGLRIPVHPRNSSAHR